MIQGAMELGALVAFIQYSERFFRPIADLSEKYNILQSAMASSERVFTLLDTPVEVGNPENPVRPSEPPRGDIGRDRVRRGHVGATRPTEIRDHEGRDQAETPSDNRVSRLVSAYLGSGRTSNLRAEVRLLPGPLGVCPRPPESSAITVAAPGSYLSGSCSELNSRSAHSSRGLCRPVPTLTLTGAPTKIRVSADVAQIAPSCDHRAGANWFACRA